MPDTIYCSSCGKSNQIQSIYCFNCGKVLAKPTNTLPAEDAQTSNTLPVGDTTQEDVRTGRLKAKQQLNNRYVLLSLLGQGGMGAVYKAEDTRFANRLVAIKEMSQSNLDAQRVQETTEQFRQEANLLASLNHPNLPSIYDHFTENGRWYLVMDFVEGTTLDRYASQAVGGILPVAEVLNIAIQLAKVLNYLHTRPSPIIFRDLKPLNVMFTPDSNVYLIDFGIARLFKQGQTRDTVAYVSQGYAAPEQFMSAQTTPQSDVYSLGATLHQLLSGSRPSANVPLFNFKPLPASVPSTFATLIMQMVSIEPTQRPASMAVIKQKLEQIQQTLSQPTSSTNSSMNAPTQRAYESTVLAEPSVQHGDATFPQPTPVLPTPTPTIPKFLIAVSVIGVLLLIGGIVFGFALSNFNQKGYSNTTLSTVKNTITLTPTATATLSPSPTASATPSPTATPLPTPTPTTASTNTPTTSSIPYPSYDTGRSDIKYYYENESDFRGKNVIQSFDSLTYQAQTGSADAPQFIACAQYTFLVLASNTTDTGRHTFTFQYGNSAWSVVDMGDWNSC